MVFTNVFITMNQSIYIPVPPEPGHSRAFIWDIGTVICFANDLIYQ